MSADSTGTKKTSASSLLDEVEKAGDALLQRVRQQFERLGDRASTATKAAADTTVEFTERVASSEASQHVISLLKEVEEAGESLLRDIGQRFDTLKGHVVTSTKRTTSKKKRKKATGKKKTAAKKTTKKKATPKKKVSAKKKATKKKPATKKKVTTKKKPAAKKKVAGKKSSAVRKKKASRS